MPHTLSRPFRFGLLVAVALVAGIAALYVADLLGAGPAREYTYRALALAGVVAAASLAATAVAGRGAPAADRLTDGRR